MVDGISSSLAGLNNALTRVSRDAQNIAQANNKPTNLDGDVVDSLVSSVNYKANAKVLKTQLDMEKRLLDILA